MSWTCSNCGACGSCPDCGPQEDSPLRLAPSCDSPELAAIRERSRWYGQDDKSTVDCFHDRVTLLRMVDELTKSADGWARINDDLRVEAHGLEKDRDDLRAKLATVTDQLCAEARAHGETQARLAEAEKNGRIMVAADDRHFREALEWQKRAEAADARVKELEASEETQRKHAGLLAREIRVLNARKNELEGRIETCEFCYDGAQK